MIEPIEVSVEAGEPLPHDVLAFLRDVDARHEELVQSGLVVRMPAFVTSDHPLVYAGLRALHRDGLANERFLEWGSGLGAATGLAALLDFEAYGIEIEPDLVDVSRDLLETHGLEALVVQGSFLPEGYEEPAHLLDAAVQTILPGAPAYDELELDPEDFAVIFSFPWPGQVEVHYDLFDHHASPGAVLMTYQGVEELVFHRKVS